MFRHSLRRPGLWVAFLIAFPSCGADENWRSGPDDQPKLSGNRKSADLNLMTGDNKVIAGLLAFAFPVGGRRLPDCEELIRLYVLQYLMFAARPNDFNPIDLVYLAQPEVNAVIT